MKHDLTSFKTALRHAPSTSINAQLSRLVPFHQLTAITPPDWLYTSGKPQRYNPSGIECVYFGESLEVARAEYESALAAFTQNQPVTIFYAKAALKRVLDLTEAKTRKALGLELENLFQNWRRAKVPTTTQLLGQAVSETKLLSAIKYPSKILADRGQDGANYVIFRDCVRAPDSVIIHGPTGKPLQSWP